MLTKTFLSFVLLTITYAASAQLNVNINFKLPSSSSGSDTVYYDSTRKLIWDDFRGKPIETGNLGAITSAGFGYKARMRTEENQSYLTINIYCSFIKSKSWVNPNKKTDYVLNHEQRHFDIAYISTGMFIKKLHETKLTPNNYSNMVKEIYRDTYSFMYKLQDQYDKETKNGQLEDKQAEWNKKIDELKKEAGKYLQDINSPSANKVK